MSAQPKPDAVSRTVSTAVRAVREHLGMSQTTLAEKVTAAGYPMTLKTISRVELGQRLHVDVDQLVAFGEALGVEPMALMTGAISDQLLRAAAAKRLDDARAEFEAAQRAAVDAGLPEATS